MKKSFYLLIMIIFIMISFMISNNKKKRYQGRKKKQKKEEKEEQKNDSGEYVIDNIYESENKENEIFTEDELDFAEEWTRLMSSYNPDYTATVQIPYLGKKVFYEDIEHVPTYISGGFLIHSGKSEDDVEFSNLEIHFRIIDSEDNVIVKKTGNKHLFNKIPIKKKGKYTIIMQNVSKKPFKTTFTMEIGSNKHVSKEHLESQQEMLEKIESRVKQLKSVLKFKQESNQERFKSKLY